LTAAGAMAITVAAASTAQAQGMPAINLGVGYQAAHFSFGEGDGENAPYGFSIDANVWKLPTKTTLLEWDVLGEFSGLYASDGHAYTYAGGVRGTWENDPKFKPYVQILLGGISEGGDGGGSDNAFLLQFGGGVIFPLKDQKFSLFANIDYMRGFFSEGGEGGQNIVRYGGGVVIPIKLK
jgi:hypothetical protein